MIILLSPIKKDKFKYSTPRRRNRIWVRYQAGLTAKAIAAHENVEEVHVRGVVKRFKLQNWGILKPNRKRLPILNKRNKRIILREVTKAPFISVESLRKIAYPYASRSTLIRYFEKENIKYYFTIIRLYLSNKTASLKYI